MRKKRWFLCLVTIICLSIPCRAAAQKIPEWAKTWEYWAEKTGNPEWAEWSKRIQDPRAIKLGQAWRDYLGYDAPSIIAKLKLAPDIKPGLVITEDNYMKYPGLKQLCSPARYKRFKKGAYGQFGEVIIAPTTHYYCSEGYLKYTKKYEGTCKIAPDGQTLLGWRAGIPFPFPKTGAEMVHSFDRLTIGSDNMSFNPMDCQMYDRKFKLERLQKVNLFWRNWTGRVKIPPITEDLEGKGEILEKSSIVFTFPYDLKGYAGVRGRFVDLKREDSFEFYLPFLRRIRKLSGHDTQDPLLGTDASWEDWKSWWQKLSPHIWPMEYRYLGEKEILVGTQWLTPPVFEKDGRFTGQWERCPCWVVDAICKTERYLYSKRRAWIIKELFYVDHLDTWDIRGELYKS